MAKQTAGVSLADEDAQITRQLDRLVLTWNKLSQSILLDYVDDYIFPPGNEGSQNDQNFTSTTHPTGSQSQTSAKKSKAKAKAKAKATAAAAALDAKAKNDMSSNPPLYQHINPSGQGFGGTGGQWQSINQNTGTISDLSHTTTTKAWRMMAGALVSSNEAIVRVMCEVHITTDITIRFSDIPLSLHKHTSFYQN